jgi:hypothetical protein
MYHFKVADILADEHWDSFHSLLADRRQTVVGLHAWLLERGYRLSRIAVWNYRRSLARRAALGLCPAWAGYSDAALRGKIIEAIQTLTARDLAILAAVAGGMAGTLQPHGHAGVGDGSMAS